MQRYFIELSYNGENYHGWQLQPNGISVQETLNKCISAVLRQDINVTGAGRTDTGVHARYFVVHFDALSENLDQKIIEKLNSFVPTDIVLHSITKVSHQANARFDAAARTYKYFVHSKKNPFINKTSFYHRFPLDTQAMNQAAKILFNHTDFTSFSKLHTQVKTNNCKIFEAEWSQNQHGIVFTIKADRFLRNMVRAIVGTLIDVGKNKITTQQFNNIIESKQRANAGISVPAHALFLWDIEYPKNIFNKHLNSESQGLAV